MKKQKIISGIIVVALLAVFIPVGQDTVVYGAETCSQAVFSAGQNIGASNQPKDVVIVDLDEDGDLDFVAGGQGESAQWYENDGDESFTKAAVATGAGSFRQGVAVGDIDGDDDLDVVQVSAGTPRIAWAENDGDENFTGAAITTSASTVLAHVEIVDIDEDGDGDIVASESADDKIFLFVNDGDENFTETTLDDTNDGVETFEVVDLDEDGDWDILASSAATDGTSEIFWLENDGDENFTKEVFDTTVARPYYAYSKDVDSDGDLDILTGSFTNGATFWLENDGSESFTVKTVGTGFTELWDGGGADFDGDGDVDIVAASRSQGIVWYENNGSELFSSAITVQSAHRVDRVYTSDLDGDGDQDIIGTFWSSAIYWYENSCEYPYVTTFSPAENATGVAVGANLVLTFSEAVTAQGTGNNDVIIYKTSDGSIVETIDIQSGQISGSGTTTITINPSTDLAEGTTYEVIIEDEALKDSGGDYYTQRVTWRFQTDDETDPVISNIQASSANNAPRITWSTDENASSQVEFGLTASYGSTTPVKNTSPRVTGHLVPVNMNCDTLYHFRVISEDAFGNSATSGDQTFTTASCSGGGGSSSSSSSTYNTPSVVDAPTFDTLPPEIQAQIEELNRQIEILLLELIKLLQAQLAGLI